MRKNNHAFLVVLVCALCAGRAMAEPVPAVATVGDIASIQSETLLGKAKLAKAQVYADLSKFSGEGGGGMGSLVSSSLPRVPRIVEVNGVREATFAYANGQVDAREGDHIPGGYVVQKIRPETSVVQLKGANGHLIEIPVSSLAGLSATQSAQTQPTPNVTFIPPNAMVAGAPQSQQPPPANVPRITPSLAGAGASNAH
ncbi:type IV pilus biogenesis protein PilP [Paraburkholderia sp. Se-20369]|nr:type IV pilus biogenesis protein PilP [Paraburkholderia sp. Se-20369]